MDSRHGLNWNREELLIAFNFYCRTPFGKLHGRNPEIIELARLMGRTPGALAMKLGNFASLDPAQKARGVKGLEHRNSMEEVVWGEFHSDWSALALESQLARSKLQDVADSLISEVGATATADVQTEREALRPQRLVQGFFRRAVLANYDETCAICRIAFPEIIIASHIIPWSVDERRRADPTNGLALCAFHDKVFDRGLISLDSSYKVLLSGRVRAPSASQMHQVGLLDIEGRPLCLPERFRPDEAAIEYHRKVLFKP